MNVSRRAALQIGLALPVLALSPRQAHAEQPDMFLRNGLAVSGHDAVAYFRDNRPVVGESGFALMWRQAMWHFASPDNMTAFEMNPTAFAPQYGGYCAYAVSRGATAPTDPAAFTVYEGKLYLNASLDVRDIWSRDIPGNIAAANKNWPGVLKT
jgi:hypothetical protein